MAEETTTKDTETPETKEPQFDPVKMSELIKQNVGESVKAALAASQTPQQQTTEAAKEPDIWDEILTPRITASTARGNLAAASAEDKVDFYSSDDWLEEVEDFLVEEDPSKRKAEKRAVRDEIERLFDLQVSKGRGLPRTDIFHAVLGEKVKKDKVKYQESIGKKATARQQAELQKAKKGVDIGAGNVNDFTPAEIHAMPMATVLEKYGNIPF